MKKNPLSCWNWKRPFRSIKNAYWRITKGFCPDDVWDWYTYAANLIGDSLIYLANNNVGVMPEYENREEEYSDKLRSIGRTIKSATNYEEEYDNPFREDYYKDLEGVTVESNRLNFENTDKNLFKHYMFVEEKNYKKAQKELKDSFDWIVSHWFELWD